MISLSLQFYYSSKKCTEINLILKTTSLTSKQIMPSKITKKRYQKKDPISHALGRPDMYVGSKRLREITEYVAEPTDDGTFRIFKHEIETSPAILRIFVEALSNAIDNVTRSRKTKTPCTKIMISLNKKTGKTSIWNDGCVVPIEWDKDEECYIHSMIFGQLLTGENYDDDEERETSGRNGLGIKLLSIYSSNFCVKGCDPDAGKVLTQEWTNNMRDTNGPEVKKSKLTKGFTEVTWTPDFKWFGLKSGYTDDIINHYTRFVVDAAMLTKVDVYFNGEIVSIKSLSDYSQLYDTPTNETLLIKTRTAEVLLTPSRGFESVSFVNGVYTRLGGQHVDAWAEAIFRPIVDRFNGKDKKTKKKTPKININDVKQFFRLFINATVVNPEFDGQDKNKLESPEVIATVKRTHIAAINKWSVIDNIEELIRSKEMVVLKKAEKRGKKQKIDGLDPDNKAGGKFGHLTSLFICEGLSAKTYVVAGIEEGVYGKEGRDWFGILPVTGKVLNVRNNTATTIASNKVILKIIHTLGLRQGVDYTIEKNFLTLNYGRIIIIADADVDGIHIEGLIINVIHALYPSLLERDKSFIVSMKTPIARVIRARGKDELFYDERRFKNWIVKQTKKINIKYYKGLGTTKAEDVPDTFGLKMVEYKNDENTFSNMQKVFHKKYADARKEWLGDYNPEEEGFSLDDVGETHSMTISDFINGEMIKFSHADCARSIPNGIDGLKESQRKLLYAVKKRKLKYSGKSLKVAQLAGYTAEHSNYHHGEKNLFETTIGMANEFPGTNNIPLLYRDGMFGCVDPETIILPWNGDYEYAKDIKVGDILIGDNGKPRIVSKLIEGNDNMYTINQEYGESYKVNSCHILTLCYSMRKRIINGKNSFKVLYYDSETNTPKSKQIQISSTKTKEQAYNEIIAFNNTLDDNNIFDINIRDYLSFSKYQLRYFKSVKNKTVVDWEFQKVPIDPYIFGMWLGDGDHNARGFSSEDPKLVKEWVKFADKIGCEVIHTTNGTDHENYHYCLRRKGGGKKSGKNSGHTPVGDPLHSSKTCAGCTTSKRTHSSCDWVYTDRSNVETKCYGITKAGVERYDFNPFVELIKSSNLHKNKNIPFEYIVNNEETRLNLLAGMIDTDGCVRQSGKGVQHIEIAQEKHTHGHLLRSLQYISRSLGFRAEITESTHKRNNGNTSEMLILHISGDVYKIPTKLPRKKLYNIDRLRDRHGCKINVTPNNTGKFVGWHIDGNERFLLGDFTVTHNTRLEGAKDAADGRYIFTKMDALTELIYREEDEPLLTPVNDDGDLVQPEYYVPIIPMILVNGCTAAIGTGWSCSVPCYNPLDLVAGIKIWLENDGEVLLEDPDDEKNVVSMFPEFVPWYRGFKGDIEKSNDTRWVTYGIVEEVKRNTVEVSELPIGMWTAKFADFCDDLKANKMIKKVQNYSSPKDVKFILTEGDEFECDLNSSKLHSFIYTSNMVLFNENNQLRKNKNVDEVLDNFCRVRFDYYIKRKAHQLKSLET